MSKQRKPASKPSSAPASGNMSKALASDVFSPAPLQTPDFFKNILLQSGLIFAFAFLLYANTLFHGFVLDDSIVILDNMFTKQGAGGIPGILSKDTFFGYFKVEGKAELVMGGRYRPLTLVLFALVYQLAGQSSFVFHLLTVLLFAVTCVVLYRTLLLLFRPRFGDDYASLLAWISTLLFTAHPIHVEVVANIKGCDEIATLLGSLGALYFSLKYFDSRRIAWAIAAALSFFMASLSKENAVTFLAVVPLALWFFRGEPATPGKNEAGASFWQPAIPLIVAFLAFFVIRGEVLHWPKLIGGKVPMELMNNPFLKIQGNEWVSFAFGEKLGTILYTLWKYVVLLFVPHPLTHDYYPKQIAMQQIGSPGALLGLALYGFLLVYALSGLRRRDPVRFGILYYLLTISIVSNIVFPVGTMMGDRFVFMPSVGFCIAFAALMLRVGNPNARTTLGIAVAVAALFSLKTVTRNLDWSSNEKLFFADVEVSANSAKIHNACGGVLFDKAIKDENQAEQTAICQQAMTHLNKAIELYPNYKDAYMSRGGCNYILKNYDASANDYRQALRLAEGDTKIKSALAMALRDAGKYHGEQRRDLANAMSRLSESWQYNTTDPETARLLGVANGVQGKHPDAIMWFEKAVQLAPEGNAAFLFDLSMAYRAAGDLAKSDDAMRRALAINPNILKERNPGR